MPEGFPVSPPTCAWGSPENPGGLPAAACWQFPKARELFAVRGADHKTFVVIARDLGRCSPRRLLMDDRLEGYPDLRHPCRAVRARTRGAGGKGEVSPLLVKPVRARGAGESPPPGCPPGADHRITTSGGNVIYHWGEHYPEARE
ncbi:hypothetical protein GCM10027514_12830 [Azotobacter armeniacus]